MTEAVAPVRGLDRRRFLVGSVAIAAGAGLAKPLVWPDVAGAAKPPLPVPEPIASVLDPGLPIHIQIPGPTGVTLLYSQTPLFGLNHERSTVGNFDGGVAMGYVLGTATGSDGEEYGLEVDIRAFEGSYEAGGSVQQGTFALI
jgi:hypothetical protein